MGSIEVGKVANIVVADGSILERERTSSNVLGGRMIPLDEQAYGLFDSFKDRK